MYIQIHSNQIRRINDTEYRVKLPKHSLYAHFSFIIPSTCVSFCRNVHKANVRIELTNTEYVITKVKKHEMETKVISAKEIQEAFYTINQELIHPFNTVKRRLDDV